MTVHALLLAAQARIAKEEHWTQGVYARKPDGSPLAFGNEDDACQWCLAGAIEYVTTGVAYRYRARCLDALRAVAGEDGIYDFNDSHTHAEVLALFDAAIDAESQRSDQ